MRQEAVERTCARYEAMETFRMTHPMTRPLAILLVGLLLPLNELFSSETRVNALYPEQDEIADILAKAPPEGLLFLVMEQDDEALHWVLPRIVHYTKQLRDAWSQLPIAVLSHGDEMFALTSEMEPLYPAIHRQVQRLVHEFDVAFHVCETYASMSDVSPEEFSAYVDVVPFGPAQIENYRMLDYQVVSIELTW